MLQEHKELAERTGVYVTEPYMVLKEIGNYLNFTLKKEGLQEGYKTYLKIM